MKILYLTNSHRPFFTDQIDAVENAGVEITTITVPGRHNANSDSIQNRSVTDYIKFFPEVFRRSCEGFDLIHANHGLTAPFAIAQPKRPIVLTLWGSELVSTFSPLTKFCSRFFDEVILPSENMAAELERSYKHIPFGIDRSKFHRIPRDEARENIGWDHDRNIVLFPYPPSRTVKNYALAENIVDSLDIDVELRYLDDVDHDLVPYYMNASNAVLVTSNRETGPMVVKEAAACDVPVLSTDVGFVSDVLEGVSHSHVCHSRNEFVHNLEHIIRKGVRSNGSHKADTWSLQTMGEDLADLYSALV